MVTFFGEGLRLFVTMRSERDEKMVETRSCGGIETTIGQLRDALPHAILLYVCVRVIISSINRVNRLFRSYSCGSSLRGISRSDFYILKSI